MDAIYDKWFNQILMKSYDLGNVHGCRLWQGSVTHNGYAYGKR